MPFVRSILAALLIALALSARAEAGQFVQFKSGSVALPGIIPGGVTVQGHRLEYNEAATRDAAQQVRTFLESALKD